MKALATIALSLVIIVASLIFLSSSLCAVSSGMNSVDRFSWSDRLLFLFVALIALAIVLGSFWLIRKLNRTSDDE